MIANHGKLKSQTSAGTILVTFKAEPREMLSKVLARLREELNDMEYTFPKILVFPNGRFLSEWKDDDLLGEVVTNSDILPGCPSGFFL